MRSKLVVVLGVLATGRAIAQPDLRPLDAEVPLVVMDQSDATGGFVEDEALDLANIVQSAAKGITTVQEAPAIVTVITTDEIRDRQFQDINQLVDTVPGWQRTATAFGTFPLQLVRGQAQAVQFLHDGLSMFDPVINIPTTSRVLPMELIKRVEFITGPGGVLWGANSLLGILNVITKDAEDIEGVEVGGSLGDGTGDRSMGRAYLMAGKSALLDGKLKLFVHGSVETFKGPEEKYPILHYHAALPQPNSANVYGPLVATDQAQSLLVSLNSKVTYGKLQLRVSVPFGEKNNPAGLSGNPARETLPEDARCPTGMVDATCSDSLRRGRENGFDMWDRYAILEYRTRFANDRAGIVARSYLQQFARGFAPLQILAPSLTIQGGLNVRGAFNSYRVGSALDGDVQLFRKLRVLYGVEAFRELTLDNVTDSRQGPGIQVNINAPYDLARIPLLCPRTYDVEKRARTPIPGCALTFAFPADRVVFSTYLNPQLRPNKKWILDIGARLSVAPEELGTLSYPVNATFAGTIVWNFIPNWHVKLNYAEGFRPPVINNTATNGESINVGGSPDLRVETSDSVQAEINARIFKGDRRIRELSFRIDGSYTRVKDEIQILRARYENSGVRGSASAELLGKLYVQGGHRLELGYTWLQGETTNKGRVRSMPENWFNLATVWNLVTNKLSATTNLKVSGAAEDPNRLVEYRASSIDEQGETLNSVEVAPTDLVLDRLPPIAELSAGLLFAPTPSFTIRATLYNAFLGHFYQPDTYFDYEPHLEYLPGAYEGVRAYVSASYRY